MQPERNHQERGNVSSAIVSITERLVKQLTVGFNCVIYMTGRLYVLLTFVCRMYVSAMSAVVIKQWGANSSIRASLCNQETLRLLCL